MGSIALLSPTVIALLLSHLSCYKLSFDGLWSSILCDMSGPVVEMPGFVDGGKGGYLHGLSMVLARIS
jgi:hypothetical protein